MIDSGWTDTCQLTDSKPGSTCAILQTQLTCTDGTAGVVSGSRDGNGSNGSRESSKERHVEFEKVKKNGLLLRAIDRVLFIMLDVPRLIYNSESCKYCLFFSHISSWFDHFCIMLLKEYKGRKDFICTWNLLLSREIVIWCGRYIVTVNSGTIRIAHGRAC